MNKLILTAVAALGLVAAVPAYANAPAKTASVPACSADVNITDNTDTIAANLASKGVKVQSVDEWNGCVRAFVTRADGTIGMQFYDPDTLAQLPA